GPRSARGRGRGRRDRPEWAHSPGRARRPPEGETRQWIRFALEPTQSRERAVADNRFAVRVECAAMAITALLIEAGKPVSATLSEAEAALGTAALVWVDAGERTAGGGAFLAGLELHPLTVGGVCETRTTPNIEEF